MSESNSSFERSYDSDDSEYNFIPGYVSIGKIEVEDDGNLGVNNDSDRPALLPSTCNSQLMLFSNEYIL